MLRRPQPRSLIVHTGNYYDEGAIVEAILPYSPADDAGLYPGEIITEINDAKIKNTDELIKALNAYNKGDKISVTYKDYERTETVNVNLAGREETEDCDYPEVYPSFARW
jgi:serine protease Do